MGTLADRLADDIEKLTQQSYRMKRTENGVERDYFLIDKSELETLIGRDLF